MCTPVLISMNQAQFEAGQEVLNFFESLLGLLASAYARGSSSSGPLKLCFEFSPAFEHAIQFAMDWERWVNLASFRVRKRPSTQNSFSALSPFSLTKYHLRPLKPVGRCVSPRTCMSLLES